MSPCPAVAAIHEAHVGFGAVDDMASGGKLTRLVDDGFTAASLELPGSGNLLAVEPVIAKGAPPCPPAVGPVVALPLSCLVFRNRPRDPLHVPWSFGEELKGGYGRAGDMWDASLKVLYLRLSINSDRRMTRQCAFRCFVRRRVPTNVAQLMLILSSFEFPMSPRP